MIITKSTESFECQIEHVVGYGKKETRLTLYTFKVEPQLLCWDLLEKQYVDRGVQIEVKLFEPNEKLTGVSPAMMLTPDGSGVVAAENTGNWSLDTFDNFVEGVNQVTAAARPYLDAGFAAEAQITDTTYVWSKIGAESVGGGLFKKSEEVKNHLVRFEILGLQSKYVRWDPEMLKPIIMLRDSFKRQREEFLSQVKSVT
jgi:hypothetical protein